MTMSMRPIVPVMLLTATLAGTAYFAASPATRVHRIATERHETSPRPLSAHRAQPPQEASTTAPSADARTMLKYRYLIEAGAESGADTTELLTLLQSREEAARAGADASELDSAVLARLTPARHAMYLALRDSDAEQRALGDFAGGLAQHAPLGAAQRRELLLAKLRHKQHYELMLEQTGIDRAGLSDAERSYAHSMLTRALYEYRDGYLEEMRAHLDAEQFRLLSDFERTEFELELQRLQQAINEH